MHELLFHHYFWVYIAFSVGWLLTMVSLGPLLLNFMDRFVEAIERKRLADKAKENGSGQDSPGKSTLQDPGELRREAVADHSSSDRSIA